jgi:hypothetical protein
MKKRNLVVTLLAALSGIVLGALVVSGAKSRGPDRAKVGQSRAANEEDEPEDRTAAAGTREELRRLRATLKQKDAQILELAMRSAAVAAERVEPADEHPSPEAPAAVDPAVQACDTLDERLFAAPADSRRSEELRQALSGILQGDGVGQAKVSTTHCSGRMCKVSLTGETAEAATGSAGAIMGKLPKLFAASIVYQPKPTERAIYVARSSDDLAINPPDQSPAALAVGR